MSQKNKINKFTWKIKTDYGRYGPINYESNKIQILEYHKKQFVKASISSRVNGPCTAFAGVKFSVEWTSNLIWGFELKRHFKGKQAGNKARGWCNYLLNNPPYYSNEFQYVPDLEVGV